MEQANVDSAKKYVIEFLVHGDVSVAKQIADPDLCVYTGLSRSGAIRGLEVYSELIHAFCTAIPVSSFTIEDSYCGEEFAVIRIKGVRNFRYDLWGVKATGQISIFWTYISCGSRMERSLKKSRARKIKTWKSCSLRPSCRFCELKPGVSLVTKIRNLQIALR